MDNLCCFSSQASGGNSTHGAGKGRGSQGPIKFGYNLVKGKASHPMEDYHVAKFVQHQGHELGLFAIYDGHLGDSVPAYLQKHLFHNILKEEEFWTDPSRSISKAYERTDQAILTHNPDLGRGGSTAVTAILINGQVLWVANVGDSRAVLSRRGQAIQMSVDHEPNTEREALKTKVALSQTCQSSLRDMSMSFEDKENRTQLRLNIMDLRKKILKKKIWDVARVNGQLAVSRAFGDKNLKNHLRSDPDVTNANIDGETDLLVLASDGVWKVMSNQEAVDIALKIKNPQKAAKQLSLEALYRESKDDISCIVVQFKG